MVRCAGRSVYTADVRGYYHDTQTICTSLYSSHKEAILDMAYILYSVHV